MIKKVSVMIPVYNGEKFIEDSINSCLNQTYNPIEIVVINDGSTDKTMEIVEKFLMNKNVSLINLVHKGKVNAINEGIKHTTGQYIAIHAADDICFNYRIEKEMEAIQNCKNAFLVYGSYLYVDEKNDPIRGLLLPVKKDDNYNYFQQLLYGNFVPGGTILFSNKIKDRIFPLPDRLLFEDWWIAFIASYYGKIKQITIPIIKYRLHSTNDNASFMIIDPKKRVKRIKQNLLRHFEYYNEFEKFINLNVPKDKEKYVQIIYYNVLKRKLLLTEGFKNRINLYNMMRPKIKLRFKEMFEIYQMIVLGDNKLYMNEYLKYRVKQLFPNLYVYLIEKINKFNYKDSIN